MSQNITANGYCYSEGEKFGMSHWQRQKTSKYEGMKLD